MDAATEPALIARPLTLPCGAVLKNRLVKSAMSDSLGDGAGNPTEPQVRLYQRWARGGVSLMIVGEVQTDPFALEKPGNLVLASDLDRNAFRRLTQAGSENGAHIWAQLGHAGALAYGPLGIPRGPSPLDMPDLVCSGMNADEIRRIPALFAAGAARAKSAGFTGVQVHAAHGFLLSQFLSPLFNRRGDEWGGTLEARARLLLQTIEAVRAEVGADFPLGLKLNCTDMLEGGLREDEALGVIRMLDGTSVDLIEISGGTYFPGAKASGDSHSSGAYFLGFCRRARQHTGKPLMTTGGFKRFEQVSSALEEGCVDAVGLARAMVLDPDLPGKWIADGEPDPAFPKFASPAPGAVTAWHTLRLAALGEDGEDAFAEEANVALELYDRRDESRHDAWRERFGRPAP